MQARDKAGSLEIVSKVLPDDDDLPDLPEDDALGDEEAVGTKDADELVLAEIAEGPESIGLDVEAGVDELGEAADFLDLEEGEEGSWALEEDGLRFEDELDLEDDDEVFTSDSEAMAGVWDDADLGLDDEAQSDDDGGLEGVEDPLLDELGIEERDPLALDDDDDDDDEVGEAELELGDEFAPSLAEPWARKG